MTSDRTRFVLAIAVAALVRASHASAQSADDEARRHYRAGAEMVRNGNCSGALAEFRQSIALLDSPNTRLLYARCLSETGDLVGAVEEFDRAERDAARRASSEPRYANTRDAAHQEGSQLAARLGRVVLVAGADGAPTSLRIGDRDVQFDEHPDGFPVLPGTVHVEASWGSRSRTFEANVTAGGRAEIRLEAPAAENVTPSEVAPVAPVEVEPRRDQTQVSRGGATWVPFVVGGLGIAGLAVGGGLYGGAWSEYSASMNSCHMACPDERLASGRGMELGAYVSFGVGAALVGAGVIAFIVMRRAPSSARAVIEPSAQGLVIRF
jgi:hypothetical protein